MAKSTVTVPADVGESVTSNVAVEAPALPSATVTSLIDSAGPAGTW